MSPALPNSTLKSRQKFNSHPYIAITYSVFKLILSNIHDCELTNLYACRGLVELFFLSELNWGGSGSNSSGYICKKLYLEKYFLVCCRSISWGLYEAKIG